MRVSKLFDSVDEATRAQKHELKLYAPHNNNNNYNYNYYYYYTN
jgi:hypothetical protein